MANDSRLEAISLADGRRLEYFIADGGNDLMIYHHGTPAAGPIGSDIVEAAQAANLTVVELVRPGYGGSSRQKGRTVADVVPLVSALADHLGADRFVTMGWSGGGPHALATAALLPDRCAAAMCLASVAPYGLPDLDFLAGMGQDNIDEFGAALAGDAELEAFLNGAYAGLKDINADQIIDAMASLLPEVDRQYLTGERAQESAEDFRWSMSTGIWGWFDDDMAFCEPWGSDLASIAVPVQIWQGSDDLMVPFAHGQWLVNNVGGAQGRLLQGHGHLSVGVEGLGPGFATLANSLNGR